MDLKEARRKELRRKLREIILALETSKKEGPEVIEALKKEHVEVKHELARFKLEQKENGGKTK